MTDVLFLHWKYHKDFRHSKGKFGTTQETLTEEDKKMKIKGNVEEIIEINF